MPNLVGIGNSQVPTNAMLGGLAYQDSVGEINIEKLKAKTTDTAKSIFVYDTRKDSDGGAWRHRTQNTSWYNEGASKIRGARKEFPAVAVIVAEATEVTIYDGDDPNLSMWMVFVAGEITAMGGAFQFWGTSTTGVVCTVAMLNGELIIGVNNGSSSGTYVGIAGANFISDKTYFRRHYANQYVKYVDPISKRNETQVAATGGVLSAGLGGKNVNEISMTLLPNAPIDKTTGLPIPAVAVASDGCINVLSTKSDNQNTDNQVGITSHLITSNDAVNRVSWMSPSRLVATAPLYYGIIEDRNIFVSTSQGYLSQLATSSYYHVGTNGTDWNYPRPIASFNANTKIVTPDHRTIISTGYNNWPNQAGVTIHQLSKHSMVDDNYGIAAFITSSFNTGYMPGDIRGSYLTDTSTDSLNDTNLVSNGSFDSNISGWSGSATRTHDSGRLKLVSNTGNQTAYTTVTCVVGKKYYFQADFQGHISFHVSIQNDAGNDVGYIPYVNYGSSTTKHLFFTATATTMYLVPYVIGTSNVGYVDNVICHLADHDRSVYGGVKDTFSGIQGLSSGLKTNGSIVRERVATGSDLVYYRNFSNTNYFSQPYNSALDFGTGDLCIMFWMRNTQNDAYDDLISRRAHNGSAYTGNGWYIQMGNDQNITLKDSVGGTRGVIDADSVYNVWRHICFTRRDGYAYAYKDGSPQSTNGDHAWTENLDNSSAILTIGRATISGAGDADKSHLALVRIGATAPSEEQIRKIFEDEKHLFQKNAKCTLTGTADAPIGIAYDDSNDILHLGTGSGRSDFRGLNRINNTTEAIGNSISASDGLIAED